jgi:hypothetical protein
LATTGKYGQLAQYGRWAAPRYNYEEIVYE